MYYHKDVLPSIRKTGRYIYDDDMNHKYSGSLTEVRSKRLKEKIYSIYRYARDLKTKGLKEIYSNKNMQRDLKTKGLKEICSNEKYAKGLKERNL